MATIQKPIFVVPYDLANIATGNEVAGHPASHLSRHEAMGLTWKTSNASNVWVRGDFGANRAVSLVSIISANALTGTKIRLRLGSSQSAVDGTAVYDSGAVDFISPSIQREDGLYHSFLRLSVPVWQRWWRIDITGHTGAFEAASLVIGDVIETPCFYNQDWEYGIEDLRQVEINRWGVFDRQDGIVLRRLDFTLSWVNESVFESTFRPMHEKLGQSRMVYICFDPEPTTYRQARTYFGLLRQPAMAKATRKARTFSHEYQIRSLI